MRNIGIQVGTHTLVGTLEGPGCRYQSGLVAHLLVQLGNLVVPIKRFVSVYSAPT